MPAADLPYRDPRLSVDERVDDLLARMRPEEKIAQLGCLWITSLVSGERFDPDAAAETLRHGIGQVTRIGASTGLRPVAIANLTNEIQRVAVERTRLGIPVVVHEESTGGFCARDATVFPQAIGLASTWDPSLVEEVAGVIRLQMLAVGARQPAIRAGAGWRRRTARTRCSPARSVSPTCVACRATTSAAAWSPRASTSSPTGCPKVG